MAGKTAKEIVTAKPSRFRELRKIEDAVYANSMWSIQEKKKYAHATADVLESKAAMEANSAIVEWLNRNLGKVRDFRQKQLYIHGPPACGKTTFVRILESCCRIYHAPYDGEWWDTYDDDSYDVIVFDEYRTQYKIQTLNRILDGSPTPMPRRGRAPFLKKKNLPCVFLSNWHPSQNYDKADSDRIAPLLSRLTIVEAFPHIKINVFCS